MKNVREIVIEDYLTEQVEARGGLCEKHTSPGRRGPPDRLITIPPLGSPNTPRMDLAETKRPKGGRYSTGQVRDHERRAELGIKVWKLHTKEQVDTYIKVVFGT